VLREVRSAVCVEEEKVRMPEGIVDLNGQVAVGRNIVLGVLKSCGKL
jgi:hypothetical protein